MLLCYLSQSLSFALSGSSHHALQQTRWVFGTLDMLTAIFEDLFGLLPNRKLKPFATVLAFYESCSIAAFAEYTTSKFEVFDLVRATSKGRAPAAIMAFLIC